MLSLDTILSSPNFYRLLGIKDHSVVSERVVSPNEHAFHLITFDADGIMVHCNGTIFEEFIVIDSTDSGVSTVLFLEELGVVA